MLDCVVIMGSTYKRGKIYWIKYYRNGKPYRESSKSSKESDATRLLRRREGDIANGKMPGVVFDRVRFEEIAEDYILDYKINGKKTLTKAERLVRLHLAPFFGHISVARITTPMVRRYIDHRTEQDASNATINRELAALKRMFNLAMKSTPPKVSYVPYIPMLKERNVRKGFFEHKEFIRLRQALPEHLRAMVTFAYKTGWRLGEITALTWDQVDLEHAIVRLEAGTTKNDDGRTAFLDSELAESLEQEYQHRPDGCRYVFHRNGKQIKDFRGSWKRACEEAGLEGKLFHDLRRTAVRNMVRAGVPEKVAMTISGHKTRSVFDRYDIVNLNDLKQAAMRVEQFLDVSAGTPAGTVLVPGQKKG